MAEDKKPAIRFKGFMEEWEERKLGEEVEITMGQSPDGSTYSNTPSNYILVQGNADLQDGWVKPRVWTTQVTKKAEAGDLIMSVRAPAGAMGKTAYSAVIGRGVAAIKGNEFIYQNLVKMNENGYWKKLSCGSTFESLNSDNIYNAEIHVPKKDEQNQIGAFFRNLDHLIALHQRKYEKLQNVKKSMLEKMFPKNGENVPEIRFKGFTNDWKQHKLGDEATEMVAGGDVNNDLVLKEGRYPIIANALTNNGIIGYYENEYRIKAPAVIVTGRGNVGHAKVINVNFTPIVRLISIKSEHEVDFLEKAINTLQIVVESTGVPQLTVPQLAKYVLFFPKTIAEEKLIGLFFYRLDHLITLQKHKLEKLQNIKKACLEKMFV